MTSYKLSDLLIDIITHEILSMIDLFNKRYKYEHDYYFLTFFYN
jgi:hypothetical protein